MTLRQRHGSEKIEAAMTRVLSAIAAAAAALCLNSCDDGPHKPAQQPISASREPGSDVQPTSAASLRLLNVDPPTRLAVLQSLIVQSGHHCALATNGVLIGGFEGTDQWRVSCTDSGIWAVWFKPDEAWEVTHCLSGVCG